MRLRTLHSDQLAPGRLLGVYVCPQCGAERRLPMRIRPTDDETGLTVRQGFPPVAAVVRAYN
jgi:hypothetical protein